MSKKPKEYLPGKVATKEEMNKAAQKVAKDEARYDRNDPVDGKPIVKNHKSPKSRSPK